MSQCASFSIENLPKEIHRFYYFLSYEYSKTIKEVIEKPIEIEKIIKETEIIEKPVEKVIEKIIEKPIEIEKIVKEIVYKPRHGILILASSLSLALGYLISDGQPREYLERFMGGSAREESTR